MTRRARHLIVASVMAGAFVAGATAGQWNPYTRHLDACHTVTLSEDTLSDGRSAELDATLTAAGWYGDPADHAERLYSPECRQAR